MCGKTEWQRGKFYSHQQESLWQQKQLGALSHLKGKPMYWGINFCGLEPTDHASDDVSSRS